MNTSLCGKFNSCSANICPLDPDWKSRTHQPGERICLWLRELSKAGGFETLAGALRGDIAPAIERASCDILHRYGPIRRALQRSAHTGSRVRNNHTAKMHDRHGKPPVECKGALL